MRARVLLALLVLSGCTPPAYKRPALAAKPASPESDAGPHQDAIHEWWYWTGHLAGENGSRYGFELTFFRVKTPPGARALKVLPAWWFQDTVVVGHAAVTDVNGKRFLQAQRNDVGPKNPPVKLAEAGLDLDLAGWKARFEDGIATHRLAADGDGFAFDLTARAKKPAARHGAKRDGVQAAGAAGVSYYVSQTRMEVTGTVTIGGKPVAVTGGAWHDHQWGSWKTDGAQGWDWYGLSLDDGTELMAWHVDPPGAQGLDDGGSFVDERGDVLPLGPGDVTIRATSVWKSPTFGREYPMGWTVELPAKKLFLTVTPLVEDQEFDGRRSIGVVYWEGAVAIEGTREGVPVKGQGYVELTNYACAPIPVPDDVAAQPCPPPRRKAPAPSLAHP